MNGNLRQQEGLREQLARKAIGVLLIAFGVWVLSLSWGHELLLVAAGLSAPTVLVLLVVWRRCLPHRATRALTLLARGRDGDRPRLRRLWRRGAVWHLAWRVPLGVTVTSLLRQREAIEQALDVSIEL